MCKPATSWNSAGTQEIISPATDEICTAFSLDPYIPQKSVIHSLWGFTATKWWMIQESISAASHDQHEWGPIGTPAYHQIVNKGSMIQSSCSFLSSEAHHSQWKLTSQPNMLTSWSIFTVTSCQRNTTITVTNKPWPQPSFTSTMKNHCHDHWAARNTRSTRHLRMVSSRLSTPLARWQPTGDCEETSLTRSSHNQPWV